MQTLSPEQYFRLKNGAVLKNIDDLTKALPYMPEDVFWHHVTPDKNDFACWARHVFNDRPLADRIRKANSRQELIAVLEQEIPDIPQEEFDSSEKVEIPPDTPPDTVPQTPTDAPPDVPPDMPPDTPPESQPQEAAVMEAQPAQEAIEAQQEQQKAQPVQSEPQPAEMQDVQDAQPAQETQPVQTEQQPDQPEQQSQPAQESSQAFTQPRQEPKPTQIAEVQTDIPPDDPKMEFKTEQKSAQDGAETVYLREIYTSRIGLKEIDDHFKSGIPSICNILFVGPIGSHKTLSSLDLMLTTAKAGKKALYISMHDSAEKIINILKSLDGNILDYINSGNLIVEKLDPFDIARQSMQKREEIKEGDVSIHLEFIEIYSPVLIVVDSISALELSFVDDKSSYRQFVNNMFKYFEKLGVRAVVIKDLKDESEIHEELFENLLADIILLFSKRQGRYKIDLIKHYPLNIVKEQKTWSLFKR